MDSEFQKDKYWVVEGLALLSEVLRHLEGVYS